MTMMINKLIELIGCHFIGDYFLQNDFLASTKGENFYHLLAHCILYLVPFYYLASCSIGQMVVLFVSHIIVDSLKARWHKISYTQDQVLHFTVIALIWGTQI